MLEVMDLTKWYGKTPAVDSIRFAVPDGCVGILLGPNGAGKSTVIKCIAGLLRFKGEILIQGTPSRSVEAKKMFGYVPEIPAMFEALSVREHLEFIRMAYKSSITDEELENLLKRFELWDKQDKMGNELSKGMMQKVSIICALAIRPKVILLDEPMVGLDPKAIKELKEVVKELKNAGVSVLISTHMLEMVEDIFDVMFIMQAGHIIGSYTKEQIGDKELDEVFFEMTGGERQ